MVPYDTSLEIAWREAFKGIAKVLTQGFLGTLGKADGITNAVDGLVEAAGSIKIKRDIGGQAWTLFWLCFGWTIDEIREREEFDEGKMLSYLNEKFEDVKMMPSEYLEMPLSFLDVPCSLPLYKKIRDLFICQIQTLRPSTFEETEVIESRFDSAFNRSLFEIWARKPDYFHSIAERLKYPGIESASVELQWKAYKQKLIWDFEVKSIFGQEKVKLPLKAIYVPLRGLIVHGSERDHSRKVMKCVDLELFVKNWIAKSSPDDDRILIGGGPGSGKSTTVKSIASVLSQNDAVKVLFVPLQYISLDGSLRDSVNGYFKHWSGSSFLSDPLSREMVENSKRLVIIFDGLDEIARPGAPADEVANLFISKLDSLVASLRGDLNKQIKVIVTGRIPSFQAAKKYSSIKSERSIEVCGYAPLDEEDFIEKSSIDIYEKIQEDQRIIWWKRYAKALGIAEDIPDALTDMQLIDVTNEPLLCYLLVLSGFMADNWENAADNRNLIYEKLIDEVWKRGWGDQSGKLNRQGPGKSLTKSDFNLLMETIALAAWLGGDTRVASEEKFGEAQKMMHSEGAWTRFCLDNGEDVANLAMNFYLKSSEIDKRGFEFTHKAFGDYLAARAIVRVAIDISSLVPRFVDAAMSEWLAATAGGVLTAEVLVAMRDELRLLNARVSMPNVADRLIDAFQFLARIALNEGLPKPGWSMGNWRLSVRAESNSESMIWAVLNSSIRLLNMDKSDLKLIDVGFAEDRLAFRDLIKRIAISENWYHPVRDCFSFVKADNSNFVGLPMTTFNLAGSSLQNANFASTELDGASFLGANLEGASFDGASLEDCTFHRANINECDFMNCYMLNIRGAEFDKINVSLRSCLDLTLEQIRSHVGTSIIINYEDEFAGMLIEDVEDLAEKLKLIEELAC